MMIEKIGSGAKWENKVGYSRIVIAGDLIEVAGTTAIDERNKIIGRGDPYLQTKFIIEKIESILKGLNLSLSNIIRTRMYITDINNWEKIGLAHGEYFRNIRPASTMVEVNQLIDPELLVEIEMTGIKY